MGHRRTSARAKRKTNTQAVSGGGFGGGFATPAEVAAAEGAGTIQATPGGGAIAANPGGVPAGPGGQPMSAELTRLLSGIQGEGDQAVAQSNAAKAELQRLMLDPNNPYSQKSLMDKSFREVKMGTTTGMAAAGQLFSGAMQEQRGIDQSNALTAENALMEQYRAGISTIDRDLEDRQAGLRSQGETALYDEARGTSALANMRDLLSGDGFRGAGGAGPDPEAPYGAANARTVAPKKKAKKKKGRR